MRGFISTKNHSPGIGVHQKLDGAHLDVAGGRATRIAAAQISSRNWRRSRVPWPERMIPSMSR